jgi:hypothetical protein
MEVRMARRVVSYLRRNHLAVFALVFAMAGTSVAAVHLGRNSVGARQIKTGAVTSAKIKNHTLKTRDFKKGLLPAGTGGGGATYWARISGSGPNPTVLSSSNASITVENGTAGDGNGYSNVTFPADVSQCAVSLTVIGSDAFIRKSDTLSSEGLVVTHIADATTKTGTNLPYDIVVHC